MTVLDTLFAHERIVDVNGCPERRFQQVWQNTIGELRAQISVLTDTVAAVLAAQAAADAAAADAATAAAAAAVAQSAATAAAVDAAAAQVSADAAIDGVIIVDERTTSARQFMDTL